MTDLSMNDPADAPLFAAFPPTDTEAWEAQISKDLRGADYASALLWCPADGIRMRPYYRREDLEGLPHLEAHTLSECGPAHPAFAIRQDIQAPTVEEANRRALAARSGGVDALGFSGYSRPDGLHGWNLSDQNAFARLLQDLPLEDVSLHFEGPTRARALLAMWLNLAQERGVPTDGLRGTVALDPITWSLRSGSPPGAGFRDAARDLEVLQQEEGGMAPGIRILGVSALPYHEAGASVVEELGYTLATARACIGACLEQGAPFSAIWQQLHLTLPIGTRFLLEVAKCRALRILLAQLYAAYTSPDAPAPRVPMHGRSSPWSHTRYAPHTNLIRGTTEAMAAVIGGCDSFTVAPYDALLQASEGGRRLARNTQLILRHEAHLHRVADPAGGAYYLEELTDQLARAAWACFQEVEARGGLNQALARGWLQARLAASREQLKHDLTTGKRALIGVNQYPDAEEQPPAPVDDLPPERLEQDPQARGVGLQDLREQLANGTDLQDITGGVDDEPEARFEPLPSFHGAGGFERLRDQVALLERRTGKAPSVFLLPFGDPVLRTARAAFARNFFAAGGFRILTADAGGEAERGAEQALASGADIVVLCSQDDAYAAAAPGIIPVLRQENESVRVVVAGNPAERKEALLEAGVDGFIYRGMDQLAMLSRYLSQLGIPVSV